MTKMQALKASILHWQDIVERAEKLEQLPLGPNNCPLCIKYNGCMNSNAKDNCKGCPIAFYAKQPGCRGTPYYAVPTKPGDKDAIKTCQEEYDFLLSIWYAEGGEKL